MCILKKNLEKLKIKYFKYSFKKYIVIGNEGKTNKQTNKQKSINNKI